MISQKTRFILAGTVLATSVTFASVTTQSIINQAESQWLSHGRDYQETRFSPLKQINSNNVAQLGLAWYLDYDIGRGFEATPLFDNGVLYTTAARGVVLAVDAKNGKVLWTYDPSIGGNFDSKGCCDAVNRGVAMYGDKVYVGTFDGRLVALNKQSGKVVWETVTVDQSKDYTITGAPRVVNGKVIIGNGGADMGTVRGYVTAYDSETGKQVWRFYTVPGDPSKPFENKAMEQAAKTWTGEWWKMGGGGTAWDSMAYDPELNLLYIGVGNGQPWNSKVRSPQGGDNLYLSSIVALNPDNGEMVWYYQETPGETWDFTATQNMILADLKINGEMRQVIMQAPKNGFFYVIDRKTGELISAEKFEYANWAFSIDKKTGRPIEVPEARYQDIRAMVFPSPFGAHNWHPMSYNPMTGLVYLPTRHLAQPFMDAKEPYINKLGIFNVAIDAGDDPELTFDLRKLLFYGYLQAWDPIKQRKVWSRRFVSLASGGTLTTAGNLVFQGSGDKHFVAYDATTGKTLWDFSAQTGIVAPAITYTIEGEQYVSVMAGWTGIEALFGSVAGPQYPTNKPRLLTFKLGGKLTLPAEEIVTMVVLKPPVSEASQESIDHGRRLFNNYCFRCHGPHAVGGGEVKDIRYTTPAIYNIFDDIVLNGVFKAKGMPSFAHLLSKEETADIKAYLISRTQQLYDQQEANKQQVEQKEGRNG